MRFHKEDISAGIVVFLVALPLCLGIALASGAPLFAGIIAGVCGGIVSGIISGSRLGVSGPAAGLTVIVLGAITSLGDYRTFLLAVVLAGVMQLVFGVLKWGKIAFFFPSSVIKGMLTAIGILIILKQIPHALGIDSDPEGDESFQQIDGENTFSELLNVFNGMLPAAFLIASVCLAILILWDTKFIKRIKFLSSIPGPLLAVLAGVFLNLVLPGNMTLASSHLVNVPNMEDNGGFLNLFTLPDFTQILNGKVWMNAAIIAVIASLETLLCVEATDKLDTSSTFTPTNRELFAQGAGNIASGLIGGIPVTQVIVRSSANIQAGGKSKASAIFHGVLLFIAVIFFPKIMNMIPLAALAAVLLTVGYKLAKPSLFKSMWNEGQDQFIPFIVTIVAIIFTDLLVGICIGLAVGLLYVLLTNFRSSVTFNKDGKDVLITFNKDVFFFNRADVINALSKVDDGDNLVIDGTNASFIDHDIFLTIEDFVKDSKKEHIKVELKNISRKQINFIKNNEFIAKTLSMKRSAGNLAR